MQPTMQSIAKTVDEKSLRAEISESWKRVTSCNLNPSAVHGSVPIVDVNTQGRLARAATPVLTRLREQMSGGRFVFMLIDSDARLLMTVETCKSLRPALDKVGAIVGTSWTEENTGTNALSTPFETRRPIFVHADEHYLDPMKDYSCYGSPIINPITRRFEGVLDIMSRSRDENALMRPIIEQAVTEIQESLSAGYSRDARALLTEFEGAQKNESVAVVGIGPSMVLQNVRASRLLSPVDLDAMRSLVNQKGMIGKSRSRITLQGGKESLVEISWIPNSESAVLTVRDQNPVRVPRKASPTSMFQKRSAIADELRKYKSSTLILGEPGTGKSHFASAITFGKLTHSISASDFAPSNESQYREILTNKNRGAHEIVLLESAHLLDDRSLSSIIESTRLNNKRLVATAELPSVETVTYQTMVARFDRVVEMEPLRREIADIKGIVDTLAGALGVNHYFDSASTNLISEYHWPGNLTELNSLLKKLTDERKIYINVSDLPDHIKGTRSGKVLTPWQRAIREVIVNALGRTNGNKAHAAQFLGISRSALYNYMREFCLY